MGWVAVLSSVLYLASDVVELAQRGFSTPQLMTTYVAGAAIPLVVIGLYAVQRPAIGCLGLIGAVGYASTFTYFTDTVLVALVDDSSNRTHLNEQLGGWVTARVAAGVSARVATPERLAKAPS